MLPPEGILNGDLHIKSAVVFGRGRFNPGVIIDPVPEFAFDPEDQERLAEFRNLVWCVFLLFSLYRPDDVSVVYVFLDTNNDLYRPTIERMNEFAPQHSRLFKEARNFFSKDQCTIP